MMSALPSGDSAWPAVDGISAIEARLCAAGESQIQAGEVGLAAGFERHLAPVPGARRRAVRLR